MSESPGTLEQLSTRVDDLERRVRALEHPEERKSAAAQGGMLPKAGKHKEALDTGSVFAVFGRALLGIAGAYLLRAVAASGANPKLLVAAIGTAYALGWLIWAARSSRGLCRYVYAATSVLILAPLLWETTLRFNVLTPMMAAGVLAGFTTLAALLELRDANARTARVVQSACVLTAAFLAFATHHVLPFVMAMLIAVFVMEYARARGYAEPAWPVVVLVTDAAIWGMIFVYSGPESARGEYVQLSAAGLMMPALLLFAIDGAVVAARAVMHQLQIGIFEIVQTLIAFGLAIASLLYIAPLHGEKAAGVLCVVLSAALYGTSFRWLRTQPAEHNLRVFGTWGAALLIAGVLWVFPRDGAAVLLASAACAAYWIGKRLQSIMLELHGAALLCAAAVVSGMAQYVFGALAATIPIGPRPSVFAVCVSAILSFTVERKAIDDSWHGRVLQFVPALLSVCAGCALLAHGVVVLSAYAVTVEAHHTAFLRTLVVSAVSLFLAFTGSRWGWSAMIRLAYAALAFLAAKLLFEDLRHGHMVFIAGSICLFAVTLIAVPRLVRWGAGMRSAKHPELVAAGKG